MIRKQIVSLIIASLIIGPIIVLFFWAFTSRWAWPHLLPQHLSWRGLEDLFHQPQQLLRIVLSSLSISCMVAVLSCVIAILSARAYLMSRGWLNKLILFSHTLPFVVPVTVFATGIHQKLIQLGWTNTIKGVVLVHLVYSLPYASFLILDAYRAVGIQFEEQAWLLGANKWTSFYKISLPLLLPSLLISMAMAFIVSFSQYFLTLMIGGGKVQTLSLVVFPYLQSNDRTIASVYSLLFLIVTFLTMGVFSRISQHFQNKYEKIEYY